MSVYIDNVHIDLGLYPDNTPVVDLENIWNKTGGFADFMIVRPQSLAEFVTAMFIADSFRERGGRINNLILPNIPGARQDRLKWEGDWLFTVKSVAEMINARLFTKVITIDPHSLAVGMIDNLFAAPFDYRKTVGVRGYDAVIAPDIGAEKRAGEAAKQLGVPVFQAMKVRDPQTNKLSGFKFLNTLIPDLNYLVVDDLCDAGGTFLGLAKEAHKVQNITLDLFVTHGLFTKGTDALFNFYERVITTDSVELNELPVETIHVVEGMRNYVL